MIKIEKNFVVPLKECYIYVHKKITDGTVFYVGKGRNHRWSVISTRSKHWKNTATKHGVYCEIVANSLTDNEAFILEKKLILLYGRQDLNTGTLTNLTEGGDGVVGYVFTDEHRRKISEISKKQYHSPERRLKCSISNTGRVHTAEARLNMSLSKLGVPLTPLQWEARRRTALLQKKKVLCVETNIIYDSLIEAAEDVQGDHSCISKVCQHKRKKHRGFTWRYLD